MTLRKRIVSAILAPTSVAISELKADPSAILEASRDQPVAILDHNKAVGYMSTAAAWERIHNLLDDKELRQLAEARLADGKKPITVSLDEL